MNYPINMFSLRGLFILLIACTCISCKKEKKEISKPQTVMQDMIELPKRAFAKHVVKEDVAIRNYFEYMDSVVAEESKKVSYPLSEHLIVAANPWLVDTLEHTDYYILKERGIFSYDQKSIVVLKKGMELRIPDSLMVDSLTKVFNATVIDVNIPEFKLRVLVDGKPMETYLIRVGKPTAKYLAQAGSILKLQTRTGTGKIVDVNKNAVYMNPVDNKVYYKTHRDDGKYTLLPRIPWIIPEINGMIYGQLIHPTTNPETLGKESSNGCMGMREGDIWHVYYHAPIGTKMVIRYDLKGVDENGNEVVFEDIYHRNKD